MLCYGIWIRAPRRGVLHPLLKPTDKRDAQQKGPYIGDFAHDIKEDFISVPSRVVFVSVGRVSISQQDIANVQTKMSQCQAQAYLLAWNTVELD